MIIKLKKADPRLPKEFTDIRIAEKAISRNPFSAPNYYIHLLPRLPEWTDRIYYYKTGPTTFEKQNLYHLTCTCSTFKEKKKVFEGRDIRVLCKHLFYKLTETKAKKYLQELDVLLMRSAVIFHEMYLYKYTIKKKDVILGFKQDTDWVNVYTHNIADTYIKFSYHPIKRTWSYGIAPPNHTMLILAINSSLTQLPYSHKLTQIKKIIDNA